MPGWDSEKWAHKPSDLEASVNCRRCQRAGLLRFQWPPRWACKSESARRSNDLAAEPNGTHAEIDVLRAFRCKYELVCLFDLFGRCDIY